MKSAYISAALVTAASGALAAPQDSGQPAASPTQTQPAANPNMVAAPVAPQAVAPIDLKAKVQVPLVCPTGIIGEKGSDQIIGEKGSEKVIGEKIIGEESTGSKKC